MNRVIGAIVWPSEDRDARCLLLSFMLKIVDAEGVPYGEFLFDPVVVANKFLRGQCSDAESLEAIDYWWKIIDDAGVRNFEDREALLSRLALCLVTPTKSAPIDFGEELSWFLEVLHFLNLDVKGAISVMNEHFSFD